MHFVALPLLALAVLVSGGSNGFSTSFTPATGMKYRKTKRAEVCPYSEQLLNSYIAQGYTVIGTANFTTEKLSDKTVTKQANKAARKHGADLVMTEAVFVEQKEVTETVATQGYGNEWGYDPITGEYGYNYVPTTVYETVTRMASFYNYRGVFLKRCGYCP